MILKSKNAPNLFLLEEIFKGRNNVERNSVGNAILSSFSKNDNIILFSTCDIELSDLLKDEYDWYHFSEKVNNKTIDFDYELKDGKLTNRNANRILQINNFPESFIVEAKKIAKELDETTMRYQLTK